LGLQGSKRSLSPLKLTDPEESPTTAKAPKKKDVIMDPTQLQLLFDKMSKFFEDATKRILTANKPEQKELNLI
ncbi:9004_t:CDS:1, partial [Racocetra persica]